MAVVGVVVEVVVVEVVADVVAVEVVADVVVVVDIVVSTPLQVPGAGIPNGLVIKLCHCYGISDGRLEDTLPEHSLHRLL